MADTTSPDNHLETLYRDGLYREIIELTDKSELTDEETYWNISSLWRLGLLDKALERSKKAVSYLTDKFWMAKITRMIGNIHSKNGRIDVALQKYRYSLKYFEMVDDELEIAATLNNIGIALGYNGDLVGAMEYYNRALTMKRKIGSPLEISSTLNNIGTICKLRGEYNKALELENESLELKKIVGNQQEIARSFGDIGTTYYQIGNYNKALEYFQKSYKLSQNNLNKQDYVNLLRYIIELYISIDELKKAEDKLEEVLEIASEYNTPRIKLIVLFCRAIVLKSNPRLRIKFLAFDLLDEILQANPIDFEIILSSISHIIELRLLEYKFNQDEAIMVQITEDLQKIEEITLKQKLISTQIDVLQFRSRIKYIQGEITEAEKLLLTAINIANKNNLSRYVSKLNLERNKIKDGIKKIETIAGLNKAIDELNNSDIKEYLKTIQKIRI